MTEVYRAEMVGVPDCEKFAPPPIFGPSAVPPPPLPPLASIPEILEVKKLEVEEDKGKLQPILETLKEAAYHAEPLVLQDNASSPSGPVIEMGPLLQALIVSSTPPSE